MGYFATIQKDDIIAVSPIERVNPFYLTDSRSNKYICLQGEKIRSVIITAKSGDTVCYGTRFSARALEKKLNKGFFLNI